MCGLIDDVCGLSKALRIIVYPVTILIEKMICWSLNGGKKVINNNRAAAKRWPWPLKVAKHSFFACTRADARQFRDGPLEK